MQRAQSTAADEKETDLEMTVNSDRDDIWSYLIGPLEQFDLEIGQDLDLMPSALLGEQMTHPRHLSTADENSAGVGNPHFFMDLAERLSKRRLVFSGTCLGPSSIGVWCFHT